MALTRPLRLKSEIAKQKPEGSSSEFPIARVWVDSGVFHLDASFDYLIPDNLASSIATGVRIQVPFHGREVEAIVVSREPSSDMSGLKSISKVLSSQSVATPETLELITAVSRRWAAHPFDIIRSAIPPRVASVEKEEWIEKERSGKKAKGHRTYIHIPPAINRLIYLKEIISKAANDGSTLVILPDARAVSKLHEILPDSIILDSHLERSERYRNFLKARYGRN